MLLPCNWFAWLTDSEFLFPVPANDALGDFSCNLPLVCGSLSYPERFFSGIGDDK